jgi:hypothetical protein
MASMFRSPEGKFKKLLKAVEREAKKLIAMAQENPGMLIT